MIRPRISPPLLLALHACTFLAIVVACNLAEQHSLALGATPALLLDALVQPFAVALITSLVVLLLIRVICDTSTTVVSVWRIAQVGLLVLCAVEVFNVEPSSTQLRPSLLSALILATIVHTFHLASHTTVSPLPIFGLFLFGVVSLFYKQTGLFTPEPSTWASTLAVPALTVITMMCYLGMAFGTQDDLRLSTTITSAAFIPHLIVFSQLLFPSYIGYFRKSFWPSFLIGTSPATICALTFSTLLLVLIGVWIELIVALIDLAVSRRSAIELAQVARQVASHFPPEVVAKIIKHTQSDTASTEPYGRNFQEFAELVEDVIRETRTYDTNNSGFVHMLMDTQLNKSQEELLINLERSLAYSTHIVQSSILFFKASVGLLHTTQNFPFTVHSLFDRALAEPKGILENNMQVNVVRVIESNVPYYLLGDISYLVTIFDHLIDNAAKWTIQGSITLSARLIEYAPSTSSSGLKLAKLQFRVQDTGCGIPAAQVSLLKKPYSTKHQEFWSAQEGVGAGLGIPTADALIRCFPDGRLDIDSEEGVGTTVRVECTLPVELGASPEMFGVEQAHEGFPGRAIKIAICAADPTYDTVASMLTPHGFAVTRIVPQRSNTDHWFEVKQAALRNEGYKAVLLDALVLGVAPHQTEFIYTLAGQLKNDPLTANIQTALLIHAGYYRHDLTKADVFDEAILRPLLYQHVTAIVRRMVGFGEAPIIDSRALPTTGLEEFAHTAEEASVDSGGGRSPSAFSTSLRSSRRRRLSAPPLPTSADLAPLPKESTTPIDLDGSHTADTSSAESSPRGPPSEASITDSLITLRSRFRRSRTTVDPVSLLGSSSSAIAAAEVRPMTVLVVEDDGTNRLVLNRMITHAGHHCVTAENGQDGVTYYEKHASTVDLILMDYRMPLMDGFQATTIIREFEEKNDLSRVEIIALTADENIRSTCLAAGMDDCWVKPVKASTLQGALMQRAVKRTTRTPRAMLAPPSEPSPSAPQRASPSSTPSISSPTASASVSLPSKPLTTNHVTTGLLPTSSPTDSPLRLRIPTTAITPSTPTLTRANPASSTSSASSSKDSTTDHALSSDSILLASSASAGRLLGTRNSRRALIPLSSNAEPVRSDYILLVEDNTTVAKIATTVLERNSQKVEWVPDGQEALDVISRDHRAFSIVLMDLHLPKLGGFDCTTRIREFEREHKLRPLYIIALTGDRHIDSEKYHSKGFNNFLRKPLNYPSLIADLPHIREQHAAQTIPEDSSSLESKR